MNSQTHLRSHSFFDSGDSAAASIAVPATPDPRQDGGGPNKRNEVAILTDHVLVLILDRLIARSLCSCKCVCRSWNSLISGSEYHKELTQVLTGFFYRS